MTLAGTPQGPFASRGLLSRRRVGRFRRIAGPVLLILIAGAVLLYRQQTRPERIWSRAHDYLAQLTGGEVTIGRAQFSLFEGIRLSQVRVALPAGGGFVTAAGSAAQGEVFRVDELHLRTNILLALLHRSAIQEIVASNAVFTLIRRTRDGRYNWQQLLASRSPRRPDHNLPLPEIRLRDARIRFCKLTRQGLGDLDTVELNVLARPAPASSATYAVQWHQRGDQPHKGVFHVHLDRPAFDAGPDGLPPLNVETVLAAMPGNVEVFSRWLALLNLRGRLGVEALTINEDQPDEALVRLEGLSLSIPLDESEHDLPPEQRLLRLERVNGSIRWTEGRIEADLDGELNGQPCRLEGTLFVPPGGHIAWADVGFELQLALERFDLPPLSDDPADRSAALIRRFKGLSYLYRRYDPRGSFGVELTIHRAPQADAAVQLDRCVVTAKGAQAQYASFPVRVTNLHGELLLTPEGITIHELAGDYGSGTVVVNGRVAHITPTTGVDLTIEGADIPLDQPLHAALQPKYQDIWKRFSPQGRVNARVHLFREDRSGEPSAPYRSTVELDFLGVSARFADLPYPLQDVRGRVVVDPAGTRVESLTARRGGTRMSATGTARPDPTGATVLDLDLQVEDLPIDQTLVECLTPAAQQAIRGVDLAGQADFAGKIYTDPQTGRTVFDVQGALRDGTARPEQIPLLLTEVGGRFRARPERVDLEGWRGRRGETVIQAGGTLWLSGAPGPEGLPWRVRCDAVSLDDELRAALPPGFVEIWDQVGAGGRIDVEFEYDQDKPASADAYRATVTAHGIGLCLRRFPWALQEVTGQVVVTPSQVELVDVRARHDDAGICLQGIYDRLTGAAQGSLSATDVSLDEPLRLAVPWRVRRNWNVLHPSGRVGLHLDRLLRSVDAEGQAHWSYQGRIELDNAGLQAGVTLERACGRLETSGLWSPQAGWTMDAAVQLDRCTLNGHALSEVRCRLAKTRRPAAWDLEDISANVHEGRGLGRVHIDQESGGGYDFSLLAQDMSLGPFLAALGGGRQVPGDMYGRVQGKLYYSGFFDRPEHGRGGGELSISGGALFRTPLMLSVLRVLDPVPPVGHYQDAALRFYVSRRQLQLHSIQIRDRSLAMTGSGTVSLPAKNLNVTLLVGEPFDKSSPLTAIPEFIQGALQELVEIRIVGDPASPRIEARPLRGLDQAVRTLTESRQGFRP